MSNPLLSIDHLTMRFGGVVAVTWNVTPPEVAKPLVSPNGGLIAAVSAPGRGAVGSAELRQTAFGLRMTVDLARMPAGAYGVELAMGDCSAAVAPDQRLATLATVHAGADGKVRADLLTDQVQLEGADGLLQTGQPLALRLSPDRSNGQAPACGTIRS